ncbi:hypothetical protein F442_17503 [Phytophthora nicotianae P10297]|uniref:Uncharacterized protein n=2 Tax=Phytophthora nicotianae TaxID=4792 RepID=W2YGL0_PHYNI|nr:hypothetical protein L914_16988 [Phytophthora nicotianae]ETP34096.1 hypothetical protein F442_17503 [Phytophthora nicotianae P10297]
MVPSDIYILHLNATKKVNQCEYPELVVDISNRVDSVSWFSLCASKPRCSHYGA